MILQSVSKLSAHPFWRGAIVGWCRSNKDGPIDFSPETSLTSNRLHQILEASALPILATIFLRIVPDIRQT